VIDDADNQLPDGVPHQVPPRPLVPGHFQYTQPNNAAFTYNGRPQPEELHPYSVQDNFNTISNNAAMVGQHIAHQAEYQAARQAAHPAGHQATHQAAQRTAEQAAQQAATKVPDRADDRVPIPPKDTKQKTAATGPMSAKVVMPQRPKPGRKAIPDDQKDDKRRYQNRTSQRKFRDKRQQKLADTQAELDTVRAELIAQQGEFRRETQELKDKIQHKDALIEKLQKELSEGTEHAGEHLQQANANFHGPLHLDTNVHFEPNDMHTDDSAYPQSNF
jgi:hypothetical protein